MFREHMQKLKWKNENDTKISLEEYTFLNKMTTSEIHKNSPIK